MIATVYSYPVSNNFQLTYIIYISFDIKCHKIKSNQISIPEEIKSRLRLVNACYYSVQNLLSSRLLSKNLKIKIHRTVILPIYFYGCETWSLTLREERKLRVFENTVLRRIFG